MIDVGSIDEQELIAAQALQKRHPYAGHRRQYRMFVYVQQRQPAGIGMHWHWYD